MSLAARKKTSKKCRACRSEFVPARPLQTACSITCALEVTKAKQSRERKQAEKVERVKLREAKAKIKTRAQYLREAQAAFNEFIRLRDRDLPCVSCGRHHEGQYHAGHYKTVAASPELRFEPLQVWKQCAPCNNHKSGDIVNYRAELIRRIGEELVAWIEGPHEPKRYTIQDLQAIKAEYRAKVRELKRTM